jgi:hypothetical protein
MADLRERLFSRLLIDQETGCLLWTGARNGDGYGQIGAGRTTYVHRLMYELFVEPIAPGLHIDHLCRVRHCAAPAHLEPVTLVENVMRGIGFAPQHAAQTHCTNGHEFTPENTSRRKRSGRVCKTCHRDRQRALYWRKKAAS